MAGLYIKELMLRGDLARCSSTISGTDSLLVSHYGMHRILGDKLARAG